MKLWVLLLAVLVGCEGRTIQINPPASAAELAEIKEKLKAAEAERDDLRAKLAAAESKPEAGIVDSRRDQKLAVGRYLLQLQVWKGTVGMGGMSDDELAKYKPWLIRLRDGRSITADQYWELDKVMVRNNGSIPDQWMAHVDWSTNPELKKITDDLSLAVHKEPATSYAARLNAAESADEKAIMVFEREMEYLDAKTDEIVQ